MALGPFGTQVWFDSHTEDRLQPNQGQRLAARMTASTAMKVEVGMEYEDASDQAATSLATSELSYNADDTWCKVAIDEEQGCTALGHKEGRIDVICYI